MTSRDELPPEAITSALGHLEMTATVPDAVRTSAHKAMSDAFAADAGSVTSNPSLEAAESPLQPDPSEAVIQRSGPHRGLFQLALVAVLTIAVAGLISAVEGTRPRSDLSASPWVIEQNIGLGDDPAELRPSVHRVVHVGPTIDLNVDRVMSVVRSQAGVLELVIDPDDPGSGRLAIFSSDVDLGALTTEMERTDRIHANPVIASIGGRPTRSWVYQIDGDYADQRGCVTGQSCINIVTTGGDMTFPGLASGPGGFVHAIEQDDGSTLILITWSPENVRNPASPGSNPFENLLGSLTFVET